MSRLQPPLAVLLFAAIASSGLVLGFSFTAQACPFTDGSVAGNTFRQPDATNDSFTVTRLPSDSKQQPSGYAELAGFGAIVGLFVIALLCNVRRSRSAASAGVKLFSQHPQLEHPELTLTSIPKEALPSGFDVEAVLIR